MLKHLLPATVMISLLIAAAGTPAAQVALNGFVVRHEANINAPAAKVYDVLVGQIRGWWNPEHTYSGDSRNLSIEARPGGCFCERLPKGGGIEHMRVIYVAPGEVLRMSGALGPLQASGLAGTLTWQLTGAGGATKVGLTYAVGGFIEGGFGKMAPAVEAVLGEQLRRLKLFIETGKPT